MSVLFVNGLVLDGLADSVVEGWVHVDGERIVGVGHKQPAPRINGRTVDLAGRTIMPGLIDAHVHMAGGDYFPGYEHEAIGIAGWRFGSGLGGFGSHAYGGNQLVRRRSYF